MCTVDTRVCGVTQLVVRRADRQSVGDWLREALPYAPPVSASHQASRGGHPQNRCSILICARLPQSGQAELASLFRELRRVLGLSLPEVARMLECRLEVITARSRWGMFGLCTSWPIPFAS